MNEFNYNELKNKSFQIIDELIKNENNFSYQQLKTLWKEVPITSKKEQDISLNSVKYEHSHKTTLKLILKHLYIKDKPELNSFLNEYKYDKKFINKYLNILDLYYECKDSFINNNCSQISSYINNSSCNDLKFYLCLYQFFNNKITQNSIQSLKNSLILLDKNYMNKCKPFLKYILLTDYIDNVKSEIKSIILELFENDYGTKYKITNTDFLPLLVSQGIHACKYLMQSENIHIPLLKNFHSLFVCPVIKEVSIDNPILLECNHVISSRAANVLSKSGAINVFKCPYCPVMSFYNSIKKLNL